LSKTFNSIYLKCIERVSEGGRGTYNLKEKLSMHASGEVTDIN